MPTQVRDQRWLRRAFHASDKDVPKEEGSSDFGLWPLASGAITQVSSRTASQAVANRADVSRLVKICSFEELRLADYEEARRYREGDWQVSASSSLLSLVMDTLTKTTHRLASAEEAISRLQAENATLKMSAVTAMDLLPVQRDLDRLRFQISASDCDVKKGKTSSPSWSLLPQTPESNFFAFAAKSAPQTAPAATLASISSPFGLPRASTSLTSALLSAPVPNTASQFGSASSGSFLGQGIKPFQLTPNSNTPSPVGAASNIATASPAFSNFSKFGEAPNAFATTPASTTPAVFNFNQNTPSTPLAQNPPSLTSSPT
ncbi:MAG: hypothetical protein Q9215_006432 [Flavoplaca cf. flavocitrina]